MRTRERAGGWIVKVLFAATVSGSLLFAGCIRHEHLQKDHGVATQAWFEAQQHTTGAEVAEGLDSEEATSIYAVYRRMLRGETRGRAQDDSPVLILQEPTHGRRR